MLRDVWDCLLYWVAQPQPSFVHYAADSGRVSASLVSAIGVCVELCEYKVLKIFSFHPTRFLPTTDSPSLRLASRSNPRPPFQTAYKMTSHRCVNAGQVSAKKQLYTTSLLHHYEILEKHKWYELIMFQSRQWIAHLSNVLIKCPHQNEKQLKRTGDTSIFKIPDEVYLSTVTLGNYPLSFFVNLDLFIFRPS